MTERVFKASYADFKLVKGRSVGQFIFEITVEGGAADEGLRMLGGLPKPGSEIWVAIAVLDPTKAASEAPKREIGDPVPGTGTLNVAKVRRKFGDMPLAAQAGMRCEEPAFRRFIEEHAQAMVPAEDYVRGYCGVKSRSEIVMGTEAGSKWLKLNREYEVWKMAVDA